jgi:hypothetical protein
LVIGRELYLWCRRRAGQSTGGHRCVVNAWREYMRELVMASMGRVAHAVCCTFNCGLSIT